ncbi:hypothetical protein LCGC14_0642170 [marine sediment metagenome]|uniref:Uncharacterized protein n=1 Tax=marine sediment metagenome TaxID=412755 RepID=A0A0F9QYW3_9ZZZZ
MNKKSNGGPKQLKDIQDEGKKISTDLTIIIIAGSPSIYKLRNKLGAMATKIFAVQYLRDVKVDDLVGGDSRFSTGDIMADVDDQLIKLESKE